MFASRWRSLLSEMAAEAYRVKVEPGFAPSAPWRFDAAACSRPPTFAGDGRYARVAAAAMARRVNTFVISRR